MLTDKLISKAYYLVSTRRTHLRTLPVLPLHIRKCLNGALQQTELK